MLSNKCTKHLNPYFLVPLLAREIITLVFGVTVLSVYVIIISLAIPLYCYRFILHKFSPSLNPQLGKILQARSQYLALEDFSGQSPRSNVVAYLAIEGYVSLEEIRKGQKTLIEAKDEKGKLKHPEATQYVTSYMGYKFWKPEPNFSIENHVNLLPSKENLFTAENLRELIEILVNEPFEPCKSPWKVVLVHNYVNPVLSASPMTVAILKFHHSLADGFGGFNAFVGSLSSDPIIFPKPEYSHRGKMRMFMFKVLFPLRMVRDLSHFIVASFRNSPWKVKDNRKMWRQLYQVTSPIQIGKVKEIKNRFGVSFTSVLHSAISAAIEKCLVKKYGAGLSRSLNTMPCIMILPLPNHPKKLRNYCTAAFTLLPTGQMNCLDRLRTCEQNITSVKKSSMPFLGQWLPVLGGSMPIPLARLIGKNRAFPVSLSNFPQGISPLHISGKEVILASCIGGPAPGVAGLGVVIHTYVDKLLVGFVGEQGIFCRDDLDLLVSATEDELNALYEHVLV